MPFQIIHRDLTTLACDAIVNPTDRFYSAGGGTDQAVHQAAGPAMDEACSVFPKLETGAIAVTDGFRLPCRYVFHTVGPVWHDGHRHEAMLLRSCYINALLQAKKQALSTIAFPLISSGTFGFPKDKVLRIAIDAISDFLLTIDGDMDVYLCVLDRNAYTLSLDIALKEYLKDTEARYNDYAIQMISAPMGGFRDEISDASCKESPTDLAAWIKAQDDNFAVTLLKLIDKSGMTAAQCYNKANVSKQTFCKINNEKNYRPKKKTILAFAIALELTLEETQQLLSTMGFALSRSSLFDRIVEFYIMNGVYDIFEIDAALFQNDQETFFPY